jgi:aminopeptidase 2
MLTPFVCIFQIEANASLTPQLVSLVAGPLSRVGSNEGRIPIAVLCPKGSEAGARFALKLASDGLCFFEALFDSLYPLPKLDLVAVSDLSSGAMENWGLITFRANHLLLDADDASIDRKQAIARVILHEISHSWFGNLVTMKYWDGLWLKEGFATFLAWYASDKLFPNWNIWNNYVAEPLQEALELDSLNSSHSVELFVADSTMAKQVFDAISYRKGCCILKMLLGEIGEQSFFDGLKLYTRRHKFGSTESADLWRALQECTDYDVGRIMDVWTKVPGFPLVRVVGRICR